MPRAKNGGGALGPLFATEVSPGPLIPQPKLARAVFPGVAARRDRLAPRLRGAVQDRSLLAGPDAAAGREREQGLRRAVFRRGLPAGVDRPLAPSVPQH